MSDVFISYSRKNTEFARKLIDRLTLFGKDSWVDWDGIPLTSPNWWQEIKTGIETADSFLFIMSPDSMASVICNMELDYAIELRKRIVPIVYQDVVTRDALAPIADYEPDAAMNQRLQGKDPLIIARDNWQNLSHINWLFFRDADDFNAMFSKLVETVETDLDYVKAHTRYLSRAMEWQNRGERVDLLLFGEEISLAEDWLGIGEKYVSQAGESDTKTDIVNPLPDALHRHYIATSRQAEEKRQRTLRNLRLTGLVAGIIGIIAIAGGVFAGFQAVNAQNKSLTATIGQGIALEQEATSNQRITNLDTQVPATLNSVSTEVRSAQNFGDSILLAVRGQDIYSNGSQPLGLSFALEASYIDTPSQVERILVGLAYQPGAIHRLQGHSDDVESVAFSPDGNLIASSSGDSSIIIWDTITGEMRNQFGDYTYGVESVAFSPDGTQVLAGAWQGEVTLWDVTTGKIIREFEGHGDQSNILSVDFGLSGTRIAAGGCGSTYVDDNSIVQCDEGEIVVWDVASGDIVRRFRGHSDVVMGVAFSSDETRIVSGSEDNLVMLWSITNGVLLRQYEGHRSKVTSVDISSDGDQILSSSYDNNLMLWDANNGGLIRTFIGHNSWVREARFSPDDSQIVSASNDNRIILWDTETAEELHQFRGHNNWINSVAFSPDASLIVSGAADDDLIIWETKDSSSLTVFEGHASDVTAIDLSPDEETLASGSRDDTIMLWDVNTGEILQTFTGHSDEIMSLIFSPDGSQIISAGDRTIRFWDVETGETSRVIEQDNAVWAIALSPDGKQLLSTDYDEMILRSAQTGEEIRSFDGHSAPIRGFAFNSDGSRIVSASYDYTAFVWDVETGEIIHELEEHSGLVFSAVFSPDDRYIATSSQDNTIILWDAENGEIVRELQGHLDQVFTVAFTPDGRNLLSGAYDRTMILWDIESGTMLRRFSGHRSSVTSITFSSDGQRIFSGSNDDRIIEWRYDTLQELQQWIVNNRYIPE